MTNKLFYALNITDRNIAGFARDMEKAQFGVSAENKIPAGFGIDFNDGTGWSRNNDWAANTYYVTKGHRIIAQNFETRESALKWLKEAAKKTGGSKGRFIPRQLEAIHREGVDYRNNNTQNVTGQDYLDTFSFRGGEFGNWMNEKDRQVSPIWGMTRDGYGNSAEHRADDVVPGREVALPS
jgi:hypothetical protein